MEVSAHAHQSGPSLTFPVPHCFLLALCDTRVSTRIFKCAPSSTRYSVAIRIQNSLSESYRTAFSQSRALLREKCTEVRRMIHPIPPNFPAQEITPHFCGPSPPPECSRQSGTGSSMAVYGGRSKAEFTRAFSSFFREVSLLRKGAAFDTSRFCSRV